LGRDINLFFNSHQRFLRCAVQEKRKESSTNVYLADTSLRCSRNRSNPYAGRDSLILEKTKSLGGGRKIGQIQGPEGGSTEETFEGRTEKKEKTFFRGVPRKGKYQPHPDVTDLSSGQVSKGHEKDDVRLENEER